MIETNPGKKIEFFWDTNMAKVRQNRGIVRNMSKLIAILILLATAIFAVASDVTDEALDRVEAIIRSETNYRRVDFDRPSEAYLSMTEVTVNGSGVAYEDGARRGERFKFSIKVHRERLSTRDAKINFNNGQSFTQGNISNQRPENAYLDASITTPRRGQTFSPGRIVMAGVARGGGNLEVAVRDRRGRELKRTYPSVGRNGRWSTEFNLGAGDYRVIVTRRGASGSVEADFRVDSRGGGGREPNQEFGDNDRITGRLFIDEPRNRGSVDGKTITIAGSSSDPLVDITIFSGQATVWRGKTAVTRGRWKTTIDLNPGEYRIFARNTRGGRTQEITFRVR